MGARAKVPAKEGRVEEPAPLSGQTDPSEAAAEGGASAAAGAAAAPAALPSGAAAGVDPPATPDVAAMPDDVVAEVMANVTRRRAGRQWSTGQIELIRDGEMSDEQLAQLEADHGFHVRRVTAA